MDTPNISLELVIEAYKKGLFPMAENRDADQFYWYDPDMRGQLPIADLKISKSLKRTVLQQRYDVRINTDFKGVIDGCAATTKNRKDTWINQGIRNLYIALHKAGHAHSVECWQDSQLVGGLYGLSIGGAFMGESMFSRARDASKVALVHLCAHLWHKGYTVLDTQFVNDHLKQFGVFEIPRALYLEKLTSALSQDISFTSPHETQSDIEIIKQYLDKS